MLIPNLVMAGEQKTDVQKFIKHILDGEYGQSYQYVDDDFSWRSSHGNKIHIKNKEDYIAVAPKIFNDSFIDKFSYFVISFS